MYKIIRNDKVVDVIKHPKFIKFVASGHIAMTDKSSAQGVVGSDDNTLYCFTKTPPKNSNAIVASIYKINETEFNRLYSLLNSGESVSADDSALAKAKRDKLLMLSGNCNNKITSGFAIELSDGKLHNFRLTTEDQLNLMQIESQLLTGEEHFVYHSTNQPCKIYQKDDMYLIVRAFRKHVLYHTTYYNVAKQYINSLNDIEKINLFSYGIDVSEVVEDVVLKQILKNGGNF